MMKRLVLLGEGHGDVSALPILIRKVLKEKESGQHLFVDSEVMRFGSSRVLRRGANGLDPDFSQWINGVSAGARRPNLGGILAVYDGDLPFFPPGSKTPFCAANVARSLAAAATQAGAGKVFSLAVVFACTEYESWLVAGVEGLRNQRYQDGRLAMSATAVFPAGNPESHGKRWLEQNCPSYLPSRDQGPLTELLDLSIVRQKSLRSFRRLEEAVGQLIKAIVTDCHVSTPA